MGFEPQTYSTVKEISIVCELKELKTKLEGESSSSGLDVRSGGLMQEHIPSMAIPS